MNERSGLTGDERGGPAPDRWGGSVGARSWLFC
jgi:hypothetical protein